MLYGNNVAKYHTSALVKVNEAGWAHLGAASTPLAGRNWIKFQLRSPGALAITYVNRNADGTFTAPTDSAHRSFITPTAVINIEPIGDTVAVYGRFVSKISTAGGGTVYVTEMR